MPQPDNQMQNRDFIWLDSHGGWSLHTCCTSIWVPRLSWVGREREAVSPLQPAHHQACLKKAGSSPQSHFKRKNTWLHGDPLLSLYVASETFQHWRRRTLIWQAPFVKLPLGFSVLMKPCQCRENNVTPNPQRGWNNGQIDRKSTRNDSWSPSWIYLF